MKYVVLSFYNSYIWKNMYMLGMGNIIITAWKYIIKYCIITAWKYITKYWTETKDVVHVCDNSFAWKN